MLWGWLIVFAVLEFYSIGITVLAYRNHEKHFWVNLIPFVCFFYVDKYVKGFKIIVIPVKKWGVTTLILFFVAAVATLITYWGNSYFLEENALYLSQIMIIPIVFSLIVMYLCLVFSSIELFNMTEIQMNKAWMIILVTLILPIPVIIMKKGLVYKHD